jgi:hypothetical protein
MQLEKKTSSVKSSVKINLKSYDISITLFMIKINKIIQKEHFGSFESVEMQRTQHGSWNNLSLVEPENHISTSLNYWFITPSFRAIEN